MKWLVVLVIAWLAGTAHAYPHYQFSSDSNRCGMCHVAPTGGGPLTQWGREEFGETLARGGNGNFLHGAIELPDWFAVGGDLRFAALANDTGSPEGTELAAFPMQAELSLGVASGAWSTSVTVGLRGRIRSGAPTSPMSTASSVESATLTDYVISREHTIQWKSEEGGAYVRAGRFAAPHGLRLADHSTYVRRYLGYNLFEETYGIGGGWIGDSLEVHATAFVADPLQYAGREEVGGAAMVEWMPTDTIAVGASTRGGVTSEDVRVSAGAHGKLWFAPGKLLLQAQVDGVRQELRDVGGDRWQLVGYAGPVWIPMRGVYTGLAYQIFDEDVAVRAVTRQAADAWISVLPRAHVELVLSGRAQRLGPHERAYNTMLQVHYNL
ncbi:MAG TPA: hypothetical protein VM513_15820 [Kofleriaceae bacterium]|nr:hypothetical protein [Kofleriaceae bacterium]